MDILLRHQSVEGFLHGAGGVKLDEANEAANQSAAIKHVHLKYCMMQSAVGS